MGSQKSSTMDENKSIVIDNDPNHDGGDDYEDPPSPFSPPTITRSPEATFVKLKPLTSHTNLKQASPTISATDSVEEEAEVQTGVIAIRPLKVHLLKHSDSNTSLSQVDSSEKAVASREHSPARSLESPKKADRKEDKESKKKEEVQMCPRCGQSEWYGQCAACGFPLRSDLL